ncbi:MAG TPA: hypothetical protein VFP65_25120 [Anaeromyxobacteraceae bacterium]|nr:hypothetical protein [Anaeromyxobacteraceae bacterium]
MAGLLFVSQAMLDGWAGQRRIDLEGHVMTLRAGDGQGRSYALDPAVRFLRVVGTDADPHALVGKVKSMARLRELGAEALGDSVVLGDVAYEVQPGFMAETHALQAAATAAPQRTPAPDAAGRSPGRPLPDELEGKRKEAEALARFLLDNLS